MGLDKQAWCFTPVIPHFMRLRQGNVEFKNNVNSTIDPVFKNKKSPKNNDTKNEISLILCLLR